jgi:hypothetical protein
MDAADPVAADGFPDARLSPADRPLVTEVGSSQVADHALDPFGGALGSARRRTGAVSHRRNAVEIKVGIQHVNREVVLEVTQSAAEVEQAVTEALQASDPKLAVLSLTDEHGRRVLIPSDKIGYVDIGEENGRRVGFGAV